MVHMKTLNPGPLGVRVSHFMLMLLVGVASCTRVQPSEDSEPTSAATYDAIPGVSVPHSVTPSDLYGEYYVGDGLGYNLHLSLKPEDTFECTLSGCMGEYDRVTGTWYVFGAAVVLQSRSAASGLLGDLGNLDIISYKGHLLLVTPDDRDFLLKWGPDPECALHRPEAEDALQPDEF
jgi:hypothetical protein